LVVSIEEVVLSRSRRRFDGSRRPVQSDRVPNHGPQVLDNIADQFTDRSYRNEHDIGEKEGAAHDEKDDKVKPWPPGGQIEHILRHGERTEHAKRTSESRHLGHEHIRHGKGVAEIRSWCSRIVMTKVAANTANAAPVVPHARKRTTPPTINPR
jgi:hypothetical protein